MTPLTLNPELPSEEHDWLVPKAKREVVAEHEAAFTHAVHVITGSFANMFPDTPEDEIGVYAIGGILVGNEREQVIFVAHHPQVFYEGLLTLGKNLDLRIDPFGRVRMLGGNMLADPRQMYWQLRIQTTGVLLRGQEIEWEQQLPTDSYQVAQVLGAIPWYELCGSTSLVSDLTPEELVLAAPELLKLLMIPVIAKDKQYSPNYLEQVRLIAMHSEELAPLVWALQKALQYNETGLIPEAVAEMRRILLPTDEQMVQLRALLQRGCEEVNEVMESNS